MTLDDLSPELREKAKACATTEELIGLAAQEGVELSDEDLEALSGGWGSCLRHTLCPSDQCKRHKKKKPAK